MLWTWPGQTDNQREDMRRHLRDRESRMQHFEQHSLQLVVDNTCPIKRNHSHGIAGVRAIYGHDDGGPDDAA